MMKSKFEMKRIGQTWTGCYWFVFLFLCCFGIGIFGCGGGGGENSNPGTVNYSVSFSFIQYQNTDAGTLPPFIGVVAITGNGGPIVDTDVSSVEIRNSSGSSISPDADSFFHTQALFYDCMNGTCDPAQQLNNTGIRGRFSSLPADTYTMDISMDNGQVLTVDKDVPADMAIPFVSNSSMNSQWNAGDLELSWTNPTDHANWVEVDEIRVIIIDDLGNEVLWVRLDPSAEFVAIPAALVAQAETLLGGSALDKWKIQTRALNSNGDTFAGGFSTAVNISPDNYGVRFAYIQYRNVYNNPSPIHVGLVSIKDNGAPVVGTNVDIVEYRNSSSTLMTPNAENPFQTHVMLYDSRTGTSGPAYEMINTGAMAVFLNSLPADTYTVDVDMDNGQTLTIIRDVPAPVVIPFVDFSSMLSTYNGSGDLELSWSNPTTAPNWNEVDELRIAVSNNQGKDVLYVRLDPTVESFTVPASLVAQAVMIPGGSGSALAGWRVRTRALDSNNRTFAAGFSKSEALPTLP